MQIISWKRYLQGITHMKNPDLHPSASFYFYNLHCTGLKIILIWLLSIINNVKTICNKYIIFQKKYEKLHQIKK